MNLSTKMFQGIVWSALERISVQTVQFALGIILARILTPKEYGIIGILLVFTAISNVFIDSGFTKALVHKQQRTDLDISTVFVFNILISIACYLILWFIAPSVAKFYDDSQMVAFLRVLSFFLVINALFAVPVTLLTISLDFKTLAKINFVSTLISGIIAIIMAINDYGVWALIGQILIKSVLTAIIVWWPLKWRPKWLFSMASLKSLFSYGSKLLISSLLSVFVNNFYSLFIAKLISTKDLGFYTRGTQFTDVVFGIISAALDNVLLPGLAKLQEQKDILIHQTRNIIKATSLIVVPVFLFLAVISEPLIRVLITEKWLPAVPIMQIFCIARLITIISGINVNLLYVLGRTDLALKQQYIKITVRVVFLILALKYGIIYVAFAELASTIIHFFINTYYPGKIMKYGAISQLKDIRLILISGIIMATIVHFAIVYIENYSLQLLVAPLLAFPVYIFFIILFKVPELTSFVIKLKELIKK